MTMVFILILVFSITTIGYLNFSFSRNHIQAGVNNYQGQMANVLSKEIKNHFNTIYKQINIFTHQFESAYGTQGTQINTILEFRKNNPLAIRAVYLFDRQQKLLFYIDAPIDEFNTIDIKYEFEDKAGLNLSDEVLMAVKAAAKGADFLSASYIVELDIIPVLDVAVPIKVTESTPEQIIVIQIDLRDIWPLVDQFQFDNSTTAFICSKKGLIIAHPERKYIGLSIAPALEPVLAGFEGRTDYRDPVTQKMLLASYSPVGRRPGWGVVVYQERDKVFAQSTRLLGFTVGVVLISIFLGAGITAIIARSITKPIKELVNSTQRIGRTGNLDFEVGESSRDEVGQLSDSFSQMIESLKKAELKYFKSEEKYKNLVENLNDVIFTLDIEGVFTYVSPVSKSMLGYEPSDLIGNKMASFVLNDDVGLFTQSFTKSLTGHPAISELRILTATRQVLWVQISSLPIVTKGLVHEIRGLLTDHTQKKSIESQLIQAQKMESVGRLAGGVAHDYNNISSIIIGYSEMALEKVDQSDAIHGDLMEILSAAKRSTDITRQLLAFARKQTIAPKVLDLNDTIESMLKMIRRLIGEDIDLAWMPGAEVWPVKMDPSQVDQILANLCVNARDAIADVGKVTIETKNISFDKDYCDDHTGFIPGEFVLLAVRDDGSGMTPETADKIFEPFFTTKGVGQGTGLGLATVYGIVKQNNGFINVYSEVATGTSIKIFLPRYTGETFEVHSENSVEIPSGHGETVLLVEDDGAILELGRRILASLNYTVLTAGTPGEALRVAEEHAGKVHLLVTDVVMPELNGRELSEQLQHIYPNLKILFMSGYTADVIAHRGVLEEHICFMQKPFSKIELALKVRDALGKISND